MHPLSSRRKPRALGAEAAAHESDAVSDPSTPPISDNSTGMARPLALIVGAAVLLAGLLLLPAFAESDAEENHRSSQLPSAPEAVETALATTTTLSPQQQWEQSIAGLTPEQQTQVKLYLATPEEKAAWANYIAPPPPPTTTPEATSSGSGGSGVWDRLAQCESGGNWAHSGGSYEGGLQFHSGTWRSYGGTQYAARAYGASRAQQIAVAEKVLADVGWGAWPGCSSKLGLR
jgi:hypothetical protein